MPKLKFKNITLLSEVDWLYGFIFKNEWNWKRYIFRKHPELKKVLQYENEKDRVKFIKEYIIAHNKTNKQLIDFKKNQLQREWKGVDKAFFLELEKILNIKWPKNKKNITCYISINPICPRFLDNWGFNLCYMFKPKDAIETIMHECTHFLYFEKWKQLYPKQNKRRYEYPYIEWHLSEIVAPIILNDKRIQKILKQRAAFYTVHNNIRINKKTAPKFFTALYSQYMKEGKSFEDFISKAYIIIKQNKKKFLNIKN